MPSDSDPWSSLTALLGSNLPPAWSSARDAFRHALTTMQHEGHDLPAGAALVDCSEPLRAALLACEHWLTQDAQCAGWTALTQCCHWSLMHAEGAAAELAAWPHVEIFPEPARLVYARALVLAAPQVRRCHSARGIPEDVTQTTLGDLERWVEAYRAEHGGAYGLVNVGWLGWHWRGELLQLGRLQFQWGACYFACMGLRHRQSQTLAAVAGPGLLLDAAGWPLGVEEADAAEVRTICEQHGGVLHAHPIEPSGAVQLQAATFSLADWDIWLRPGDPVLSVHIPAGAPLEHAAAAASYERACTELPGWYPERPSATAFCCDSWLMDPQLGAVLPPQSNVVRFNRDWLPVPLPGGSAAQLYERVFGSARIDPATAPRDTTLRRAVLDHVDRGEVWRKLGGLIDPQGRPWQREQVATAKSGCGTERP